MPVLFRGDELSRHSACLNPFGSRGRVSYDDQSGVLSITGKPEWQIKGKRQRAAIAYMFQQYQMGRKMLLSSEIIAAVYAGEHEFASAARMGNIFQLTPWQEYIKCIKRGVYAFEDR